MSIRKFLAAILCLVASIEAFSLNIKVRLLTEYTPTSVVVSAVSGRYSLICDKQINAVVLEAGTSITLTYFGNRVKVEKGIELLGTFTEVEFIGTKYNNVFSLKTDKLPQERVYEENL